MVRREKRSREGKTSEHVASSNTTDAQRTRTVSADDETSVLADDTAIDRLYDAFEVKDMTRGDFRTVVKHAPTEELQSMIQAWSRLVDVAEPLERSRDDGSPLGPALVKDSQLSAAGAADHASVPTPDTSAFSAQLQVYIRNHPFNREPLVIHTVSERRKYARELYDFARAHRLSSSQAANAVKEARRLHRKHRHLARILQWLDIAKDAGRSAEDELERIRMDNGWETDEMEGDFHAEDDDDLQTNFGTEIDDTALTLPGGDHTLEASEGQVWGHQPGSHTVLSETVAQTKKGVKKRKREGSMHGPHPSISKQKRVKSHEERRGAGIKEAGTALALDPGVSVPNVTMSALAGNLATIPSAGSIAGSVRDLGHASTLTQRKRDKKRRRKTGADPTDVSSKHFWGPPAMASKQKTPTTSFFGEKSSDADALASSATPRRKSLRLANAKTPVSITQDTVQVRSTKGTTRGDIHPLERDDLERTTDHEPLRCGRDQKEPTHGEKRSRKARSSRGKAGDPTASAQDVRRSSGKSGTTGVDKVLRGKAKEGFTASFPSLSDAWRMHHDGQVPKPTDEVGIDRTGERESSPLAQETLEGQQAASSEHDDFGSGLTGAAAEVPEVPAPLSTPSKPRRRGTPMTSPYFRAQVGSEARTRHLLSMNKRSASCIPVPPLTHDAFGLIQEKLAHEPFQLLVAVTFLNRTRGAQAIPVFYELMARYPTPADLAEADESELAGQIRHLGLQNTRARRYIQLAQAWIQDPPVRGRRHRKLHYPGLGDGKDIKPGEILDDADERAGAWEIAHLPTTGPYAIDSWRIFCRDELRGKGTGAGGPNESPDDFEPEWKRVLPLDKELRAYLRWRWLREGWQWNPRTGHKVKASEELMARANQGTLIAEVMSDTESEERQALSVDELATEAIDA